MEVLTPARLAELKSKNGRPTKNAHVYEELFTLNVDEVLQVTKREWRIKTPPYWTVNSVARMRKCASRFTFKTLLDGRGWLITRIK
jgi:hypothetical protein